MAYTMLRWEFLATILPIVIACLLTFAATVLCGRTLALRVRRRRTQRLNDLGTVELEFAFAFPVFLMMILITIQMALMINASLVVDYAAFCAARSAAVWLPYQLPDEDANTIRADKSGRGKWERIRRAASIACLPIAPRFSGVGAGALGLAIPLEFDSGAVARLAGSGALEPNVSIDYLRLSADIVDKWITSYLTTDVELFDRSGQVVRQFPSGSPVTARVTHKFYMNVPFAGAALGKTLGSRYFALFGPYYVPLSASYTLQLSQA